MNTNHCMREAHVASPPYTRAVLIGLGLVSCLGFAARPADAHVPYTMIRPWNGAAHWAQGSTHSWSVGRTPTSLLPQLLYSVVCASTSKLLPCRSPPRRGCSEAE